MRVIEKDSELLDSLITFYEDIDVQIKNKEIAYDDVSLPEMVKRREQVRSYIINYATTFLNNVLSLDNIDINDIKYLISAGRSR